MAEFPHLNLLQKLDGRYQFRGRAMEKRVAEQTQTNLGGRAAHGTFLSNAISAVSDEYGNFLSERHEQGLPEAFDPNIVPIFLQVDPNDFDIESLKGFGIEIVSEEENGFIIGANADNFVSLGDKITKFVEEEGRSKDQAAKLWQIIQGTQWRIDYILSGELREKYIANAIDDHAIFDIDISIACYVKMPERPVREEQETDEKYAEAITRHKQKYGDSRKMRKQRDEETEAHFEGRLETWRRSIATAEEQRDEIASQRQQYLTNFITVIYKGELLSSFVDMGDSFGFKARMSGQSLKDLIKGYAYLFEISESEQVEIEDTDAALEIEAELEIMAPDDGAPTICVIDSGIQEQHIMLAPAILAQYSKSYVPGNPSVADEVANGGHGTKVAGAILYGNEIPDLGNFQLPCFIVNARVLDQDCNLPSKLYPPQLMAQILDDFDGVKLFNLSITSFGPCRNIHMSSWAAKIDSLIHDRQVLFILAAGNLRSRSANPNRPGIQEHLEAGRNYPDFLLEGFSRIANPAQSMLGLTVGSACHADFVDADRISFGQRGQVSSFSRSGPGLWGCVKPDIVEYGGDFLREKNGYLISQHNDISTRVVKSGGARVGYGIGTSFAAPKAAHIIALLAAKFPNESTLLYKALIVQSARLPEHVFHHPTPEALKMLGFGLPDIQRALENTPHRITFVTEGRVAAQQANLYSIRIPTEITRAGSDFDVLVEVTLTYTATPRRTRRRLKSYFGSWLSWESSRLGESFDTFSTRILKDLEDPEDEQPLDNKSIRWTISTSATYGHVAEFKRQDSATQKDWTVLKSNTLTDELSFAIIGHKGWDKDTTAELPFALTVSFEAMAKENEIYNEIEVANRIEIEPEVAIALKY